MRKEFIMALVSRPNAANDRYSLVEDALIVQIFKTNEKTTISEVEGMFTKLGFNRTTNSLRYRITKLGEEKVNSFQDLHKGISDADVQKAEAQAVDMLKKIQK